MKFEIDLEIKTQIQVSFNTLKNTEGGKIHIYYFSGERYQHWARIIGQGMGNIHFLITDEDNNEEIGIVKVDAETPEEEKILNMSAYHSRNKETDQFLLIPFEITHSANNFQYKRNF